MEFLKCQDVRWKGREKQNKPDIAATTAKHPDSHSQSLHYSMARCNQRICAEFHFGRTLLPVAASVPAIEICSKSIMWIGHHKEIRKLTFRALALRQIIPCTVWLATISFLLFASQPSNNLLINCFAVNKTWNKTWKTWKMFGTVFKPYRKRYRHFHSKYILNPVDILNSESCYWYELLVIGPSGVQLRE